VTEKLTWRPTEPADLDAIAAIGNRIHAGLPERPAVFAEKLRLFPEGCFSLIQTGEIVGYGISHPWLLDSIPPLDAFLGELPASPDCLFVHDVAVLPRARGRGAAGALVDMLVALAQQRALAALALVSVYDTHALWARYGFAAVEDSSLAAKLASYGDTARTMRRAIP
jgi:ribosomal protein S18 acetylase RimI-like enzyme